MDQQTGSSECPTTVPDGGAGPTANHVRDTQAGRVKLESRTPAMIETQRYAVYRPFPWKQQRRGPDGVGETRFSRSAVSRRQSLGRSLCAEGGTVGRRPQSALSRLAWRSRYLRGGGRASSRAEMRVVRAKRGRGPGALGSGAYEPGPAWPLPTASGSLLKMSASAMEQKRVGAAVLPRGGVRGGPEVG